jgi:hypothetical protein
VSVKFLFPIWICALCQSAGLANTNYVGVASGTDILDYCVATPSHVDREQSKGELIRRASHRHDLSIRYGYPHPFELIELARPWDWSDLRRRLHQATVPPSSAE